MSRAAATLWRGGRSSGTGHRRAHLGAARRLLSALLILAGALMLLDVGATLVWQEPVTAVIGLIERAGTDTRYSSYATMPLSAAQRTRLELIGARAARIAYLARQEQLSVPPGAAIGRLVIPSLGVDYFVVQGTGAGDLERGPGHYAASALPGEGATVAIAGHRTTYLAPFRNIDDLRRGQRIVLRMPYGVFTYAVTGQRIVAPTALWITRNLGHERLVLSSCNPLYSASQRIAVFARLVRVVPSRVAAGRSTGGWTIG